MTVTFEKAIIFVTSFYQYFNIANAQIKLVTLELKVLYYFSNDSYKSILIKKDIILIKCSNSTILSSFC